ncbi:MAG: leucine-rich repeat domain-containing protein [Bacteroidales bacterium]|nr:leucine-rich repeat domain-containing protein [Bacteroidales bacterium]
MKSLYCYDNQIQGEAMDALIGSLPVVESGSFYVFHEGSEEEGNVCTKKQVEAANQKGWKVYKKTSGGYELYAGEDDVLQVENIEFADAKVKAICIENWDKNNDGELSKAEAAAVTDLKSAFVNKTDIRSFEEFKYFTGYKGEAYRSAFNGCTNLTRITLPESMEIIPMEAFAECSSLSQIEIPANVKEIYGGAFTNCASLTSISLPLGLKEIDISLFFGCSKLTTINIPNSVEVIKLRAFSHCDGLQTFEIPEGVQKLDQCIFENCTNLKAITIPKSVTSIANNVVHGCQVLTSVTSLIENPFEIEEGTFYTDWGTPPTATLYVPVGTKTKYQATTGWNQFAKIREIGEDDDLAVGDLFTEQTIEGVTMTFMVTSLDPMECQVGDGTQACIDKATTGDVTVPAMPRGFVTRRLGDYGFAGCSKVEHFWMNDSIWYIGAHAFDGCLTARSVDLPRYVREVAHDFVDHEMEIHVPATASQSVIEAVAQACERTGSTVSVSKPEEAALERVFIWRQVRGIDEHAFGNMPSVKEMVVDAENPYFDSRGNCHAILRTEDNTLLFGCQNTFIPETVTAIAAYAFEGHNKLKGITIPAAVKSIGEAAFIHCDKMTLVKSLIVHPFAIADNTFDDAVYQTAKLLVPFGTKELYASTDGWKNFFNIEEMEMKELAQGGTIVNGGNGGSIDEGTALDGNVIGDVYYNIGSENGGYNANEGCITVTKPTADEQVDALEGQDIFGEDMKNNFTGIVFKVPAGKGTIRVTAKTTGSMVLKVKIGNAAPMEIELEGKLKATFPYEVATPSYVYIYAGQTAAGVKAQSGAVADGLGELKIYDIELSTGEDGIDEMTNDGLRMTDTIYSISGQRLSKPQRGVNIINGKKVLIK